MVRTATFDFTDEIVVVTGGAGALGGAVVDAFVQAGASVAAIDVVDPDEVSFPSAVTYVRADLTDEDTVAETMADIEDTFGHIDILANIAGTWEGGSKTHETDADVFDTMFDVNLRTMFLASKHALPALQDREGAIVSVASRSSLAGGEGDGLYRASKAGVRILTETIAEEYRGTVRANCVMPSVLDTPMNREMMEPSDDWVAPADVAEVILLLCSSSTSVTSGASVPVYGEA